jgi:hypothetical protein
MNYKIITENNTYSVFENATDQIIKSFPDRNDAKNFMRKLNLGCFFDGWTPTFFMVSVADKLPENKKNINRKRKSK